MPLPLGVFGTQILNNKSELVRLLGVYCSSLEWTSDGGHIVESVQVVIIYDLYNERNKVTAFTQTGVGQRATNATWWTDMLLETLKSSPSIRKLVWVLVWRNADLRQNYAPFPDTETVENFRVFEAESFTLFMEDLAKMYE